VVTRSEGLSLQQIYCLGRVLVEST
jgi:hypothetical protein